LFVKFLAKQKPDLRLVSATSLATRLNSMTCCGLSCNQSYPHSQKPPEGGLQVWRSRERSRIFCLSSQTKFLDPDSTVLSADKTCFRPSILHTSQSSLTCSFSTLAKTTRRWFASVEKPRIEPGCKKVLAMDLHDVACFGFLKLYSVK